MRLVSWRAKSANDQYQRSEPAAAEQRTQTEPNGWLRSAGCCGSAASSMENDAFQKQVEEKSAKCNKSPTTFLSAQPCARFRSERCVGAPRICPRIKRVADGDHHPADHDGNRKPSAVGLRSQVPKENHGPEADQNQRAARTGHRSTHHARALPARPKPRKPNTEGTEQPTHKRQDCECCIHCRTRCIAER